MTNLFAIIAAYILIFATIISAAPTTSTDIQQINNSQAWKSRPRQFRMQVFSRPNNKGAVQTIRTANGASPSPCWNLASKRVGSYELNDPLIKVTFYRSSDCHGAPSATFYNQNSSKQSHILLKAKSVSITKVKPIVLKDQHKSKRSF